MAAIYHQLGIVAQKGGRLDDAEQWYAAALRGATDAGDVAGASISACQLGAVAEQRGQLRAGAALPSSVRHYASSRKIRR